MFKRSKGPQGAVSGAETSQPTCVQIRLFDQIRKPRCQSVPALSHSSWNLTEGSPPCKAAPTMPVCRNLSNKAGEKKKKKKKNEVKRAPQLAQPCWTPDLRANRPASACSLCHRARCPLRDEPESSPRTGRTPDLFQGALKGYIEKTTCFASW